MIDVEKELATLEKMPRTGLIDRWRELYGSDPPSQISRDLMTRTIAYKIQEQEYGGLDQKTKRTLRSLARTLETEGRLPTASGSDLKPGAKLIREWHGKTYTVIVHEEGFEFGGERFRSLSRIAREITGARWSGRRFFGITQNERSLPSPEGEAS